jgi:hypothetical protein
MRTLVHCCLAALVALGAALPAAALDSVGDDLAPCCFTNPRYAGVCQVVPGEGETCATILAYLNNQTSAGKTYCGSTTIRGGWTTVACNGEDSATACTVQPASPSGLAPAADPRSAPR